MELQVSHQMALSDKFPIANVAGESLVAGVCFRMFGQAVPSGEFAIANVANNEILLGSVRLYD